jgi:hypothetical protein
VQILQFKASYLLSEITTDVRNKMAQAIASVISVNASKVVLSIVDVSLRRRKLLQQQGVLVGVYLQDFKGSPLEFAALLTQERLNAQMTAFGLKPIQLISTSEQTSSNSTSNSIPNVLIGGIVGGVVGSCVLCTLIVCTLRRLNVSLWKHDPEEHITRQPAPLLVIAHSC